MKAEIEEDGGKFSPRFAISGIKRW